jgi:hypothetical protein
VGFYAAFSHNRFGGINGAKIKTTFLEQLNSHLVGWFFFFFSTKKRKRKKRTYMLLATSLCCCFYPYTSQFSNLP